MTECNPLVKMGKTKSKRAARLRQTKKRRDAKRLARKREIVSDKERNAERIVLAPDPPSPSATEVVRQDARDSTDVGKGNTKRESNVFEEQSDSVCKDRECADCQRLRTLLYEEQCKPRASHSECVQCQSRREARIMEAKQSLHYRMYSGESVGSRCFLAALAAKKKKCTILI